MDGRSSSSGAFDVGAAPPGGPGEASSSTGRVWLVVGVLLLLFVGGVATFAVLSDGGSEDAADVVPGTSSAAETPVTTATPQQTDVTVATGGEILLQPAALGQGEILLEPVAVPIDDAFTSSAVEGIEAPLEVPLPPLPLPTTTALLPAGTVGLAQVQGDEPGLYGGTRDMVICDTGRLVEFLEANPDKAVAWAGVQGIAPEEIRSFVAGLTPVLLTRDTRVTNHGFVEGAARPHQSVLQAGHAVLVDEFGVPRAKCSCGNPLAEPQPVASAPIYVGDPWPGFEGGTIVVVVPDEPVEEFEVVDPLTGAIISIPRRDGEELLEPETLPVSLDGLYDCGEMELVQGDDVLMGRGFMLLLEDGTIYRMMTSTGGSAEALANMGPGTELEISGTYTIDGSAFAGEVVQPHTGIATTLSGLVVSPDLIEVDQYGTCVRAEGGAAEPPPADLLPVEPPEFTVEDLAMQYLDLLLLDCGLDYDEIQSSGGDDTSWRLVVPTDMGDVDVTVFVGTGGDDVVVQPNNQLAADIAVECGFYEP